MTDAPVSAAGAGIGRSVRPSLMVRLMRGTLVPVLTVVVALILAWYAAVPVLNAAETLTRAERAGAVIDPPTAVERRDMSGLALALRNPGLLGEAWSLERPRLPAPHRLVILKGQFARVK